MVRSKRWCCAATIIARNNALGLEFCTLVVWVAGESHRELLLGSRGVLSRQNCRTRIVLVMGRNTPLLEKR
jgi:hypothetical protein